MAYLERDGVHRNESRILWYGNERAERNESQQWLYVMSFLCRVSIMERSMERWPQRK